MRLRNMRWIAMGLVFCGGRGFFGISSATAQFASSNVSLHSHVNLTTLGASAGNDCWGYVSPSGREYALMSVNNKLAFVEITVPAAPVIVATVSHTSSTWGDVKVYQHVAYAVTEASGTGIQVIDMTNIDGGTVSLVRTITAPGRSHNVALDTDSGFLYTCGSRDGAGTTVIFDLSNPTNPVQVGTWTGAYQHDAQIVTYTSGPYAGRQILFGASEGRGVDIVDVTNKSNTFLISRTPYTNVAYCHQLWTEDLRYLYINDELDSIPRTIVFDIANLSSPVYVGEFTSGTGAIDHNNYVHNGLIFNANYRSGLRIFNVSCDPVNPPQVGWFDTYPENDGNGFDGAWSCYPYFPSGTVIVSDINRGLFILDPSAAQTAGALEFDYPNGHPALISPLGGTAVRVHIDGICGGALQPGTATLHYDMGQGFLTAPLQQVSAGVFDAVFPAAPCPAEVDYYVSAQMTNGATITSPPDAPVRTFTATAAVGVNTMLSLNFEANPGWAVTGDAGDGQWDRGIPIACSRGDPPSDFDGSSQCMLTDNSAAAACNSDVDGGSTILTTSSYNLSALSDPYVGYARWYTNTFGSAPEQDVFVVEASDDNGATWVLLETVGPTSTTHPEVAGGWVQKQFRLAGFINLTPSVRFRFTASDLGAGSVVEAGIDAFRIFELDCNVPVVCTKGDVNDDSTVDGRDAQLFVETLVTGGTPGTVAFCATDMDDDGVLEVGDDVAMFVDCLLGLGCP